MNTAIWANLFWKEWREHQWKLAALTAILFGTFLAIWLVDWREGPLSASWIILTFYTPLAALFVGMGVAAGEQSQGTIESLQRLPMTPRSVAIAKLLVGWLTVVIPGLLLVACGVLFVSFGVGYQPSGAYALGPLGTGIWWVDVGSTFLLSSLSLLLWASAIGVNQATELRAGALALVLVVSLWATFGITANAFSPDHRSLPLESYNGAVLRHEAAIAVAAASMPGGNIVSSEIMSRHDQTFWSSWILFAATHGALATWFVFRFGRVALVSQKGAVQVARFKPTESWLRPPRRSRLEAILWKQFREAAPIVGGVVVLAAGWALFVFADSPDMYAGSDYAFAKVVGLFAFMTALCGFLAALMVGIGGFQDDLNPGTSTFWRSRPIPPTQFFWLKYAGGLAALAVVFGGALLASYLIGTDEVTYRADYIVLGVVLCLLTYSTAACLSCLVRNAIYAGILSILPAGYGAYLAFEEDWPLPLAARVTLLLIACVAITVLGWLAMRNDWSLSRG